MFPTIRKMRKRLALVSALAAATILAVAAGPSPRVHAGGNLPVFTSPIDITGTTIQVHAVVPDRDTGKSIEQPLPLDLSGPAFSTPLSTQLDQYWSVIPDKKTGKIARDQACDEAKVRTQDAVSKIGSGFSAYNISCSFASTGKVYTELVGSALYLSYQLTDNSVDFSVTTPGTCDASLGLASILGSVVNCTPATCNPDHASFGCLSDPRLSVTFTSEIWTVIHAADICSLSAESGNVDMKAVNIDSHNFSGDLSQIADALVLGHKFTAAEIAMENAVSQQPLPLDASLKQLRDACKDPANPAARALAAYHGFEPAVEAQGIIFRLIHPPIDAPVLRNGDQVIAPSFQGPRLTTTQPAVTAGTTLQLSGQYFHFDNPVLGFVQPNGPECIGAGTELEWGPAGGQAQRQMLNAGADGMCPISYDGAKLSPSTAYQFRARNCDLLTCSAWSALFNGSTAAGISNSVTLTIDSAQLGTGTVCAVKVLGICASPTMGSTELGTATIDSDGTFSTTVTIPAGTAAGSHTIHAAAGDAQADASIQVTAPTGTAGGNATIVIVGVLQGEKGCPPHILTSTQTDAPFFLSGNGFAAGTVTIYLDSTAGTALGTVAVAADANGNFCAQLQGVPRSQAGAHTLVAVENGTVQAKDAVTFVPPSVVN